MIKTQDLYTTLLGAKGQVESDSSTVEKLCRTCNTILGGLDADKIDEISKELSSCSEKVKNLVQKYEDLSLLKNNVETINSNLVDPLKKFLDNMAPILADSVYDACDRLRDDFDLFEGQIWNNLPKDEKDAIVFPRGLTSKNHLRIFLMGEFSSGKTTFIQRLLMQKAGEIASNPTTGLLVIHRVSDDETMEIMFKNTFSLPNTTEFYKFLAKYGLANEFDRQGEEWSLRNRDVSITLNPSFNSSTLMEFVNAANEYAEAFLEIRWFHRRRGRDERTNLFDFADLYDMPGAGSSNEQHNESIDRVLRNCRPDIIFYLVDSGYAIPSDDGSKLLISMLESMRTMNRLPLFFWVYEKPIGVESDTRKITLDEDGIAKVDGTFLVDMKEALLKYIDSEHTNEEAKFSDGQKTYLRNSFVLDARGNKSDSTFLENAISLALQQYFCKLAGQSIEDVKLKLADFSFSDNKVFDFINSVSDSDEYSVQHIFDELRSRETLETGKLKLEHARNFFIEKFSLDGDTEIQYPEKAKEAIERMKSSIISTIDDILSQFTKGFGEKTIDSKKVLEDFPNLYKRKDEWRDLVCKVQGYHWLRYAYSGEIAPRYLMGPGSAIIGKIEKDVKKLSDVKTELPLCEPLE